MRAVPREMADRFAEEFAGDKKGFSAKEITDYFSNYSNMVKPSEHYGINPTRRQLFIDSLYCLLPKEQYYALTGLCRCPPQMKNPAPAEQVRNDLLSQLHSYLNVTPIGLKFSQLREHTFRQEWFKAYNRITSSPASAITSARTFLETVFTTIITERNETPDSSGDLSRLLRQAEEVLNFNKASRQEEHRILTGLTNVINGVCGLSNIAGDRHGLVDGQEIDDPEIATLIVNASGAVALFFICLHLFAPLPTDQEGQQEEIQVVSSPKPKRD